jgi:hypothetical protein
MGWRDYHRAANSGLARKSGEAFMGSSKPRLSYGFWSALYFSMAITLWRPWDGVSPRQHV